MAPLWLLPWAAWVQEKWDTAVVIVNRVRRRLLLPLALWGGRDMALLKNGQWIDGSAPPDQVCWRYDSEKHTLVYQGAEGSRLTRWPWLSVVCGERDLSDFFQGLRLSAGQQLAEDKAVMLFAHQKRWVPTGSLQVVHRDGTEDTYILDASGLRREAESVSANERIEQVNYIK